MTAAESPEQMQAQVLQLRRMAAKSPFKKDRDRFIALAEDYERRCTSSNRPDEPDRPLSKAAEAPSPRPTMPAPVRT